MSPRGRCVLTCQVAREQLSLRLRAIPWAILRVLASTSVFFPGRFLLVPHCLNSCMAAWPLLDCFLQWQVGLNTSWHSGMNKDMRMPMVPSLLQGYLVQTSTERQWLDLIFSKTKHCQAGEQTKGRCLVRTEMRG